jgi:hypothetical protein
MLHNTFEAVKSYFGGKYCEVLGIVRFSYYFYTLMN